MDMVGAVGAAAPWPASYAEDGDVVVWCGVVLR
jgi:hypothetical protein